MSMFTLCACDVSGAGIFLIDVVYALKSREKKVKGSKIVLLSD